MQAEEYTIKCQGETWTRDTLSAAKRVADAAARIGGMPAVVLLTETGWVEYAVAASEQAPARYR